MTTKNYIVQEYVVWEGEGRYIDVMITDNLTEARDYVVMRRDKNLPQNPMTILLEIETYPMFHGDYWAE